MFLSDSLALPRGARGLCDSRGCAWRSQVKLWSAFSKRTAPDSVYVTLASSHS